MWSLKCVVKKMSGRGNVRSGKCPSGSCRFGELFVRENARRGSVLGEVSVGELSSRGTVQSGNCPHTGNFTLSLPLCYLLDLETTG